MKNFNRVIRQLCGEKVSQFCLTNGINKNVSRIILILLGLRGCLHDVGRRDLKHPVVKERLPNFMPIKFKCCHPNLAIILLVKLHKQRGIHALYPIQHIA